VYTTEQVTVSTTIIQVTQVANVCDRQACTVEQVLTTIEVHISQRVRKNKHPLSWFTLEGW